ncbi:MAG TPA: PhoH family protein [Clostridiales bacterium]|jgi:phosphate starvation-inducible PhoH-like protein|nr:PhoH family protein [Clostridiales bacterium]
MTEKSVRSDISVRTDSQAQISSLFGAYDANIKIIEEIFNVTAVQRDFTDGCAIVIQGEDGDSAARAAKTIGYLKKMLNLTGDLTEQSVSYVSQMVKDGRENELGSFDEDCICITDRGKPIRAKTIGQKKYIDAIRQNTIVLGVGPAGTGKTFLAVAMAVTALRNKEVQRIILTRPAVEAGEKLGFLPGDLQTKIEPYLRPLYDALYELMGTENYQKSVERGVIEIAPLAYMRGRTLNDSFIILDEAQNTTPEQMKMFLTRLGYNSKAVVTGDITQTDLPDGTSSGLVEAVKVLNGIGGISVHYFDDRDVVRHRLVQKIILAYDRYEKEKKAGRSGRSGRHGTKPVRHIYKKHPEEADADPGAESADKEGSESDS